MTAGDSFSVPRDDKQVRNVAQKITECQVGKLNKADELQHIVGGIHEHKFIKEVCLHQGRSPIIIGYTDEQISDLKRFSAVSTPQHLRSIIGVDRTFNLGPCFVTLTVFKNMALVWNDSRDNPLFVGPVIFHYDAIKILTASSSTSYVTPYPTTSCACAEISSNGVVDVVLGSDDERALVNAFTAAFPSTSHVFCSRHLQENVRRYLADDVGIPFSDRNTV